MITKFFYISFSFSRGKCCTLTIMYRGKFLDETAHSTPSSYLMNSTYEVVTRLFIKKFMATDELVSETKLNTCFVILKVNFLEVILIIL